MTPAQFNVYVSWIVYAVVGKTSEADAVLREHRDDVLAGAEAQRRMFPPPPSPVLYRGLLLEPEAIVDGRVAPDTRLESVSFTEDLDVAHYFADPASDMSALVRSMRPRAEGYIGAHEPTPGDVVLFHHAWQRTGIRLPDNFRRSFPRPVGMSLGPLAAAHLGQDLALQLVWSLRLQREVILLRDDAPLPVRPRGEYPSPPTKVLNERFTPPFVALPKPNEVTT